MERKDGGGWLASRKQGGKEEGNKEGEQRGGRKPGKRKGGLGEEEPEGVSVRRKEKGKD